MILRFPVPGEPVSANSKIANPRSRGGAIGLSRHRQAWRDTAQVYAEEHPAVQAAAARPNGLGPSYVRVTLGFANQRTRDPHNYTSTVVKWIIDGMVRAGAWPDDNPEYVEVRDPVLVVSDEVTVEVVPRTVKVNP